MPLSPDEQYLLDAIETGLRNQDPAFATKLTDPDADQARRRSTLIAHACLWYGDILKDYALIGFFLIFLRGAKPATIPIAVPMATARIVTMKATWIEVRIPNRTRLK